MSYPRFTIIWDNTNTKPAVLDRASGLILVPEGPQAEADRIIRRLNANPSEHIKYDWPADGSKGWEEMATPE